MIGSFAKRLISVYQHSLLGYRSIVVTFVVRQLLYHLSYDHCCNVCRMMFYPLLSLLSVELRRSDFYFPALTAVLPLVTVPDLPIAFELGLELATGLDLPLALAPGLPPVLASGLALAAVPDLPLAL